MRHHAITWQDGAFARSASILSFDSRAARAAYPQQCAQRVEPVKYAEVRQYKRAGYPRVPGLCG